MIKLACCILLFLSFSLVAEEEDSGAIIVKGKRSEREGTSLNIFETFKSEYVSQDRLSDSSNQSLVDVLQDQRGVEAQVYCANCGAKRVTINGLKGEHTSLLVDGLPLHSAISSFYGLDNIPVVGIDNIEVMRGTGASLTNPEAIGGTIDIQTVNPLNVKNRIVTSWGINSNGELQSQNNQFAVGAARGDKKAGFVLLGQHSKNRDWDEDHNNIAEMPNRENVGLMLKGRMLGPNFDSDIRIAHSRLEVLGGHVNASKPNAVRSIPAVENNFEGGRGDVDGLYSGDPLTITDWIEMKRSEAALNLTVFASSNTNLNLKSGLVRQEQSSIYQHGFDYSNADNMWVSDFSVDHIFSSFLSFNIGAFIKKQKLRSSSRFLFEPPKDLPKDNFDYSSHALYAGATYYFEGGEIDLALRLDHLEMNWLELTNQIDKWILAPRLMVLHNLTHDLTQRFSYGLGYRAPLTFFESQHGNNESGYVININELEKSHSLVYSMSYNKPRYYITGSTHVTFLKKMAYGEESFNSPINYLNSHRDHRIWASDLLVGYKVIPEWLVELSFEHFNFDQDYKRKLPTAAIENRLALKSSAEFRCFKHYLTGNLVFARNLEQYGRYTDHYRERNQSLEPVLDTSLARKRGEAPTYFTLDSRLAYSYNKKLTLNFTVNNIFNFTQVGDGDSPATWHWHFNHAHFDGLHTWGPNAGREFILSLEYLL